MRSGYTLPVFATAAAVAAIRQLQNYSSSDRVEINLIEPLKIVNIPIEQVAKLTDNQALAITRSDPGDNLDITRNTPIWALVTIKKSAQSQLIINGGEGIGKIINADGQPAIYQYARNLLEQNIIDYLKPKETIEVTIILPHGKKLAQKTSNAAFGVIEGLSLLGTTGISQPLTSKKQLELYQQELITKASKFDYLVFCIGENGINLAQKMGINPQQLVKTANWLGAMLVQAGMLKLSSIILFGYHGKLIKLAGGIFHTHHHLADARLEILTAHGANLSLPTPILQQIFNSPTTESALQLLRKLDEEKATNWVEQIYNSLATSIKQKCEDYIFKHSEQNVNIEVVLFDGDRQIINLRNNLNIATIKTDDSRRM
jgi:cobalt-precorrin-5B (C1)-methyltransferase